MGAVILRQIPYPHTPRAIAADDLSLVGVNNHIVGRMAMVVAPLDRACFCFPNFDRSVFRACHHPLALTVKRHTCNVPRVALKRQPRVRIGRFDVVELDGVMTCGGEEALIG